MTGSRDPKTPFNYTQQKILSNIQLFFYVIYGVRKLTDATVFLPSSAYSTTTNLMGLHIST